MTPKREPYLSFHPDCDPLKFGSRVSAIKIGWSGTYARRQIGTACVIKVFEGEKNGVDKVAPSGTERRERSWKACACVCVCVLNKGVQLYR